MPFQPDRGSQDSLISLSGMSLGSTTGVYLISGASQGQCTIISTGNSFITFYPPTTPPGDLRSGNFLVYNKFNTGTTTQFFTWINTPYISGINPNSGFSGTYFRISGSGARDYTGLWFNDLYTGVLTDPIFENSTWLRSGIIPFVSGGLNSYFSVKVMSEGGSSVSPRLFYIREDGLSLSGITNFPTPIQGQNYLRGTSAADGLEWQTPNQVLNSLTGLLKSGGDDLTGNYRLSGNLTLSGIIARQLQLINDPAATSGANILSNYSGQLYWSGQKVGILSGVTEDGVLTYNKDYQNINVETGILISGQRIELGQIRISNTTTPFDPSNVISASGRLLMWTGAQVATLPTPVQPLNYLRENSVGDSLEWRTPNQALNDMTGVLKSGGDNLTGNYYISGGAIYVTGLALRTSGFTSGDTIFRTTLFSGNTILCDALIGGVTWRAFSYRYA